MRTRGRSLAAIRVRASFSRGGDLSEGATGRAPQRRPDSRRFLTVQHFRNYKLNLPRIFRGSRRRAAVSSLAGAGHVSDVSDREIVANYVDRRVVRS